MGLTKSGEIIFAPCFISARPPVHGIAVLQKFGFKRADKGQISTAKG